MQLFFQTFEETSDLFSHLKEAYHAENKIGCGFCEAYSIVEEEQVHKSTFQPLFTDNLLFNNSLHNVHI